MSFIIFYWVVLMSLMSFINSMKHFLSLLLSMEILVLSIYFMMSSMNVSGHVFFNLFYLIIVVGEGVLGLSILVYLGRSEGLDYCNMSMMI